MNNIIKLIAYILLALTSTHIGAMQLVKKRLSKTPIDTYVSNIWTTTQLNTHRYTQQELNQKLFDTVSIDPDKKISVIKKLIERGANVNYIHEETQFPVLYSAIAAGHLSKNIQTIELLIKKHVDLNKTITIAGQTYTPLAWAQLANSPAVIQFLKNEKIKAKK